MITYRLGNDLDLDQVVALYESSTLAERRPMRDRERVEQMVTNANLVVTAWDGQRLVGMARSLTDFAYVTYVADLAVCRHYQQQGIGRELLRRTQQAVHPEAMMVLLAAPLANEFYRRVGFEAHPRAWQLPPGGELK
jgi:ribosomal protein S18 acetylase RimI-like enzyme